MVQSEISDFGSEMQDSSNFEMSSPMDVSSMLMAALFSSVP
jgi:hypothetical protein